MGRMLTIIYNETERQRALNYILRAPLESRVEIRGPKRTTEQNDRMWAMLTDIVKQRMTCQGREFDTDSWKAIFMQALGHEVKTLPNLDTEGFFVVGHSSSKLSKAEMGDLIDFITAWGNENGVIWSDPALQSYEDMRR